MEDRSLKIGLVLEGGAMRGMFTAGVLDIFMEEDIRVDEIVGVSAGALFGVNYLSRQPGRALRYNKRFNSDKNYVGIRPLLREGNLFSTKYAYDTVPRRLDPFDNDTYKKNESAVPFYAVVTSIETGEPEYMRVDDVFGQMDVLRASGSMPFVSKPVALGDGKYLDGGISDSIPFEWMAEQGCDRLIVVLTREIAYCKKPMPAAAARLYRHKYPQLSKRMAGRHDAYNGATKKLAKWEKEGRAFVLRPSEPISISRLESDPDKLQGVYDMGRRVAGGRLGELREYLT